MRIRTFCFAALVLLAMAPVAMAAYNPALKWYTISTEHFDVHFHEGEEWTARQVAQIAEEVRPHIVGLYEYDPGRCHFVILDDQDYANGAAFYYDNKIEIWATNLEFGLRGTTQWLRNVVTHEYTHVVSIQAAMKLPLHIPALYFQVVGFENEKRPDVLTGYPDRIISYPFVGAVVPPWWAEGVAQYQSPTLQTDCWDSHRDMILRAAVVDDEMLTYDEMGFFGHGSLGNEEVYDHGYGLVRYIAHTYGPDSIRRISEQMGKIYRLTIDGAIKKVTGKSGQEVYNDWVAYLRERYDGELADVRANPREGRVLCKAGYWNIWPTFSPDGKRVALLSNKGSDYAGTSLYLTDRDGKKLERLSRGVSSRPTFSPDGGALVYGRHVRQNLFGSMRSDLFRYDFETKKEKRLTEGLRAAEPTFSPDGKQIVFVINGDGTHTLAVCDSDGKNVKKIVEGPKGMQYYGPVFSPDGSRILFGMFDNNRAGTRALGSVAPDGSDLRTVLDTPNDERDARWSPDGKRIIFSSDRTGIFNVYSLDTATGEVTQMTNVVGGAFSPDVAPDGALVYAAFSGTGYHIAFLDPASTPVGILEPSQYADHATGEYDECAGLKRGGAERAGSGSIEAPVSTSPTAMAAPVEGDASPGGGAPGGETPQSPVQAEQYRNAYTDFQLFPRVVLYDGTPRFGAFLASNEMLDRQSLFAGGSYGTNGEYDGFVLLEFRRWLPVIYMQFFGVREKYTDWTAIEDILYKLDIRYDLWSADMGVRFEFEDPYSITVNHDLSLWYSHSEYKIHIDPFYRNADQPDASLLPDQPIGWKYYIGNEYYLQWHVKGIKPARDSDINPRGGREWTLQMMHANDELFTSGEFEYGIRPSYTTNDFNQYTLDYKEYLALPWWDHSLQVRLKGAAIDHKVDDFFYIYMGGLDGIRGYTYYSIGGRRGVLGSVTYRFPIWRHINRQFLHLTFKDIYGGAFFESANAWNKAELRDYGYKKSAGYEVRLNMGSFYAYPTTVNFVSAYPLDDAVFFNPSIINRPIVNEKKWRYYVTVGFTF